VNFGVFPGRLRHRHGESKYFTNGKTNAEEAPSEATLGSKEFENARRMDETEFVILYSDPITYFN
jgi:hypothetical protein